MSCSLGSANIVRPAGLNNPYQRHLAIGWPFRVWASSQNRLLPLYCIHMMLRMEAWSSHSFLTSELFISNCNDRCQS